ncbi:uncharacterized protein C9orf40 homolog [Pelobates fuscus]|uniref:uncharacterized protein C9orf40 homolog n=1 Tax=Pelobates fuscus TaxID=191477 RepID=UPI002FE4D823
MAKRNLEQHPVTLRCPPCKKRACELPPLSDELPPHGTRLGAKRKLESDPGVQLLTPSPCASPADCTLPPSKKPRAAQTEGDKAPVYKCQDDENFREYNSYQFWKTPLPDIDFSEITTETTEDNKKDDELFREFNSHQFWKTPLPNVDFSEIETCENSIMGAPITSTDITENMDS